MGVSDSLTFHAAAPFNGADARAGFVPCALDVHEEQTAHRIEPTDSTAAVSETELWPIDGDRLLAVRLRVVQGLGRRKNEGVHSGFKLGRELEGDVVPGLAGASENGFSVKNAAVFESRNDNPRPLAAQVGDGLVLGENDAPHVIGRGLVVGGRPVNRQP